VRELTPKVVSSGQIIEVGGESSVVQSLAAFRLDGLFSFVGSLTAQTGNPGALLIQSLLKICNVYGFLVRFKLR
jgi:methylglyoxal synthase